MVNSLRSRGEAELKAEQSKLDAPRLVFIDETAVTTKMVRHRGRSPRGQRLVASVPHGHWKTLTFVAALRINGLTAPYVIDGAMDGPSFLAYVEQVLAPTLRKGDIVFMDNLRTHKIDGVRQALEAVGAKVRYLPAYSPDLNPIEMAFSKLKTALRKGSARTVTTLMKLIGKLIKTFALSHRRMEGKGPVGPKLPLPWRCLEFRDDVKMDDVKLIKLLRPC